MAADVLHSNRWHFDQRLFLAKPHAGQLACDRWIADDIEYSRTEPKHDGRIQDHYSIRCAPHVIGVLLDSLTFIRTLLETEINSSNDNPLFDPATGDVLHGGNFYGGHPCMAMDLLKIGVANIADLVDRQMALLCNPHTNNGLPSDLVARAGTDQVSHHGFKAMQISASALAAEALKLTMPASVFSRSTESHNQDKVSMGTIAARDALRIIELTETVLAIVQLAVCQAVDLRPAEDRRRRSRELHQAIRAAVPMNDADRRMDVDIHRVLELHRAAKLPIGQIDFPAD
jgi:histidine ammonia-lyase